MHKYTLDDIDIHILSLLQQNSRITNAKLAKAVGLSQPPCLRRVKILEDSGYITGYTADINEAKCGFPITVFALVRLKSQTTESIEAFSEILNTWDMVRESHMISGESDFILRIIAPDWAGYKLFLTDTLISSPEVATVRSNLCIGKNKNARDLPKI